MALKKGYEIWNSTTGVTTPTNKVTFITGTNPRPASISPQYFEGTNDLFWKLIDNVNSDVWGTDVGQRNGIAVTDGSVVRLYDVKGFATSDTVLNCPWNKLSAWLSIIADTTTTNLSVQGQYNGTYPALPSVNGYCYTMVITAGAGNWTNAQLTAYDVNAIAMLFPLDYLNSDISVVSCTSTVITLTLCSKVALGTGGYTGFPTSLLGATSVTYAFTAY